MSAPQSPASLAPLLAALAAIGPFAIDTYLPAFPQMAAELGASQLEVQQTLTAFLAAFAAMALWHGALADALGRRRVVLASLVIFLLASVAACFSTCIEHLWLARAIQGLSSGAGMVVSRAVVRDLFAGAQAQRLMAQSSMMFALAPAVAPITGGLILTHLPWQAIFAFLALYALALILAVMRWLPETLPREKRQPLHPVVLARSYQHVFTNRAFMGMAGAVALNFLGFFLYVLSAPVFLMEHLGVSAQGFGWLFIPTVSGMMLGSGLSSHLAGRRSPAACVRIAFTVMTVAVCTNLILCLWWPPTLPWSVIPIFGYSFGMAVGAPALQLMIIDLYPKQRGLVSSCLAFLQSGANATGAAILAPLFWGSPLTLALGMALMFATGVTLYRVLPPPRKGTPGTTS